MSPERDVTADEASPATPQDPGVPDLDMPLARFGQLVRILAGDRGHMHVWWSGQGHQYRLSLVRGPDIDFELDYDTTSENVAAARRELIDRINPADPRHDGDG